MTFFKIGLMNKICVLLIMTICIFLNSGYIYASKAEENILNKGDVKQFVEELVTKQLREYHIAGASVAIVKNGDILYTNGFGKSDIEKELENDSHTLFRVGSITKLFTWTALMQLIEQGKVGLDEDINTYIGDINIPSYYNEPITVRNLMTHTAGFEDRFSNLFMSRDKEPISLKEFVIQDKRMRIFPPGKMIAYSNYGALLAGYIIEEVSGMKYQEYVKENILVPLDMDRTTFNQPASKSFQNVSKAHGYSSGRYNVYEDASTNYISAGAMSTSANNLVKFMLMHLEQGQYNGKSILREETLKKMHSQQYVSDEDLPGMCLGFMEWKRNNKRIIWHSGGTAFFKSLFLLIPNENIGVFISYNSPNSEEARNEFRQQFLDRYYPIKDRIVAPIEGYRDRVYRYEGYFKEGRIAVSNSDKLIYALSRFEEVTANEDGTLTFRDTKYIEVKPMVFKELDGQGKLVFQKDDKGNIQYLFQDFEPHEGYIKLKWYENQNYHIGLFCICLIIFILTLLNGIKKLLFNKKDRTTKELRKIENLLLLICSLNVIFPLGATLGLWIEITLNPRVLFTGAIPLLFKVSLFPPIVSALLTIITFTYLVKGYRKKHISFYKSIYVTIVLLSSLVFICWMHYWNLLGVFR